jgi:trehalose synthase
VAGKNDKTTPTADQRSRSAPRKQDTPPPATGNGTAPTDVQPQAPSEERRRRRRDPNVVTKQPVAPPPPKLDDYEPIVGRPEIDELRFLAEKLRNSTVKMVNSTAVGGGVAELLNRQVPLLNELGVKTRWDVITGGNDFFEVTKAFHNALHGGEYTLTRDALDLFMTASEQNRQRMEFGEDVVVINDPQPAALVRSKTNTLGKWLWRCHMDLSNPNQEVWGFFRPLIEQYDAALFSAPAFARQLPMPQYLFYPSIDPLSEKNRDLEDSYVQKVCDDFGVDRARPIVTQISRFDRLKDPVGVIQAYKMVKKYVDCQLVLAGGGAKDDPEGALVLQSVMEAAGDDPDVIILNLPPWSALEINALQRASTIIVQKSLKEGFALTVAEGLWKAKPVIGSAVGGIPVQIIHKLTGVLVHSVEGCAYQIRYLLTHPEVAEQLGRNGREHVKENFLITTDVKRWLALFQVMLGLAKKEKTS